MKVFIRTIYDYGIFRLLKRVGYEFRKIFDRYICKSISLKLIGIKSTPKFKNNFLFLSQICNSFKNETTKISNSINFELVGKKETLKRPFYWNNPNWTRLWQFNLNYFDWARNWLDECIDNKKWIKSFNVLSLLIEDWIELNKLGYGDGWHSYTLSLRIRNWIWIFVCNEKLIKQNRLDSLWTQICWLDTHLENANGGNHYLENLITLIFGSLQFDGLRAQRIYINSMKKLENELNFQILDDGGHEERSASYHILILDHLVELGCVLESLKDERPFWLVQKISEMFKWLNLVYLNDNKFPRFNDSPYNGCPSIEIVHKYAKSYIEKRAIELNGLRGLLLKSIFPSYKDSTLEVNKDLSPIIDLPSTGWIIARPNCDWELLFKNGESCPRHLPGHCHSDLLSFDIFHKSVPKIAEVGTSIYGNGNDRMYERSSKAHNVFQIAPLKKNNNFDDLNWVEPIEIWGAFRAGRKSRCNNRKYGFDNQNKFWLSTEHNGFAKFGCEYKRNIYFNLTEKNKLFFKLIDNINCKKIMAFRQFWHLGPYQEKSLKDQIIKNLKFENSFLYNLEKSYYSEGFGSRIPSNVICIYGKLNKGINNIEVSFTIN